MYQNSTGAVLTSVLSVQLDAPPPPTPPRLETNLPNSFPIANRLLEIGRTPRITTKLLCLYLLRRFILHPSQQACGAWDIWWFSRNCGLHGYRRMLGCWLWIIQCQGCFKSRYEDPPQTVNYNQISCLSLNLTRMGISMVIWTWGSHGRSVCQTLSSAEPCFVTAQAPPCKLRISYVYMYVSSLHLPSSSELMRRQARVFSHISKVGRYALYYTPSSPWNMRTR